MKHRKSITLIIITLSALLLSFASVRAQVNYMSFHFIKVHQEKVHNDVLEGKAGNPWQYRILAEYMLEPVITLFRNININRPQPSAFIFFRFLQNTFIFIAAAYFYKKLGLSTYTALLGITILAWMISQSFYDSDLSFNTYFDVLFYLLAGIIILYEKYLWLLLLMVIAAFNRETCGLIILLLPAYALFSQPTHKKNKQVILTTFGMGILYTGIFLWLRVFFGEQQFLTAHGNYPGKGILYFNIFNLRSWEQIWSTAGIIPFLALFSYRKWPKHLKVFFWVIVPVWGIIHFLASVVAETRLFLVPLSLIFIPCVLFGLNHNQD